MQIAARTAAWAKSGYTAKDYIQDGLVAMWDGIENAGWGVHDPNATVWKDLVGTCDINIIGLSIGADYVKIYSQKSVALTADDLTLENVSLEIALTIDRLTANAMIVYLNDVSGWTVPFGFGFGGYANQSRFAYNSSFDISRYPEPLFFKGSKVLASITFGNGAFNAYFNGKSIGSKVKSPVSSVVSKLGLGASGYYANPEVSTHSIRLYAKRLTASDVAANYAIDKARFNLPET